jgi:hypothetical protein
MLEFAVFDGQNWRIISNSVQQYQAVISVTLTALLVLLYFEQHRVQRSQTEIIQRQTQLQEASNSPLIIINKIELSQNQIRITLSNEGDGIAKDLRIGFHSVGVRRPTLLERQKSAIPNESATSLTDPTSGKDYLLAGDTSEFVSKINLSTYLRLKDTTVSLEDALNNSPAVNIYPYISFKDLKNDHKSDILFNCMLNKHKFESGKEGNNLFCDAWISLRSDHEFIVLPENVIERDLAEIGQ